MATYYPQARATLIVQFDEQGEPINPAINILGPVVPGAVSNAGFATLSALDLVGNNPLGHSFDITEIMHLEVAENGYRMADTCDLTLDFSSMPFTDPRMIRAMGILVYMGSMAPNDFPRSLPASSEFLQFVGFLDEIENDFEEGATAKLKFRDYTALFIDTPQPEELSLVGNLTTVLNRILGAAEAPWEGIQLEVRGADMLPALTHELLEKNGLPDLIQRQQQGPEGTTPAMPPLGKEEGATPTSAWDLICELCNIFGVIATISLSKGDATKDLFGKPVRPRGMPVLAVGPARAIITPQTAMRTMIYGRNLKDLKIKRKFGCLTVPQIVVKSYNPSTKKTVTGKFPPKGNIQNPAKVYPSGRKASDTPKTFNYEGLKDEAAATRAAESIHTQLGRQELGGSLSTESMASFVALPDQTPERDSEAARDPLTSLLTARPGDPLRIVIAEDNPDVPGPVSSSAYGKYLAMSEREIIEKLVAQGYRQQVAAVIARSLKGGVLQQAFLIRNSRKVFDHEEGFSYAAEFMNYVELHQDANIQKQSKQSVPQVRKANQPFVPPPPVKRTLESHARGKR